MIKEELLKNRPFIEKKKDGKFDLDEYNSFVLKNRNKNIVKIGSRAYVLSKNEEYNEKTGEIKNIEDKIIEKKRIALITDAKCKNKASIYELCSQADQFNSTRRTLLYIADKLGEVIEKFNTLLPEGKKIKNDLSENKYYKEIKDIEKIVNKNVSNWKNLTEEIKKATAEEIEEATKKATEERIEKAKKDGFII